MATKQYQDADEWYASMTRKSKAEERRERTALNKQARASKQSGKQAEWERTHSYKNYGVFGVTLRTPRQSVKGRMEYFVNAEDRRGRVIGQAVAVGYNHMREARKRISSDRPVWVKFDVRKKGRVH